MDILVTASISGLFAGALHALSGPDHLAALAPLVLAKGDRLSHGGQAPVLPLRCLSPVVKVSVPFRPIPDQFPPSARFLGLRWGLGHGAGVLLLGIVAIGLKGFIPAEALSGWGERVVGASLILVGLWGLRKAFSGRVHVHEHSHDGLRHAHVHAHATSPLRGEEKEGGGSPHRHSHAATSLGLLHGFAGGSHLLFLTPALALPGLGGAIGYLGGFVLGSALAMEVFVQVLARSGAALGAKQNWLLGGASVVTLAVGGLWMLG